MPHDAGSRPGSAAAHAALLAMMFALAMSITPEVCTAAATSPLALSCIGCHRHSPAAGVFVALNTLPAASIENSLRRSRDQPEAASIMSRFVKTMSDDQIRKLATELSAPP